MDYETIALRFMENWKIERSARIISYRPTYDDSDIQKIIQVLKNESVWRSDSEACQRLISAFRKKVNPSKHLIPISSASAGIHIALTYFLRTRGNYVLIPSYTWYAVAATVLNCGGIPLFWDLSLDSLKLSSVPPTVSRKRIACCVTSHLFGIPSISDAHLVWLRENDIPLVEDCAQSALGSDDGIVIGRAGAVAIYSFNGSKHIPAGEGGMLVTNDEDLASFCNNFIMTVDSPKVVRINRFNSASEGWNYRLGAVYAALAESLVYKLQRQLDSIDSNARTLAGILSDFSFIKLVDIPPSFQKRMYLGYPVLIATDGDSGISDVALRNILYFILRYAGVACTVWVDEPIQCTQLLKRYYREKGIAPKIEEYKHAHAFANRHLVFTNVMKLKRDEKETSVLKRVLSAAAEVLLSKDGAAWS